MVNSIQGRGSKRAPSHKDVVRVKVDRAALPAGATVYAVLKRDTLSEIAKKQGVPLEQLKAANPGLVTQEREQGHWIYPGDEVVIPAAPPEGWKFKQRSAAKAPAAATGSLAPATAAAPGAAISPQNSAGANEATGTKTLVPLSEGAGARAAAAIPADQYMQFVAELAQTDPTLGSLARMLSVATYGAQEEGALKEVPANPQLTASGLQWARENGVLDALDAALIAQKPDGTDPKAVETYKTVRLGISMMRAEQARAKLPPPSVNVLLDLSKKSFTDTALETAAPLRGPTEKTIFDDYWKANTPSLKLMDSIAAQMTQKPPPAGNQGVLHARLAQELARQFPDASIDFVVLPTQKSGLIGPAEGVVHLSVTKHEKVESKMTQTVEPGGTVMISGQVTPGTGPFKAELAGELHDIGVEPDGKWTVVGVPAEIAKNLPAVATLVRNAEVQMFAVNTGRVGQASALYGKSPQEQAKTLANMANTAEGLVGGFLTKVEPEKIAKLNIIAQLGAKQLLAGNASDIPAKVSIDGAKDLKRDFTFATENAAAIYEDVFMAAALAGDAPQTWESTDFEKNIGHAMHLDVDPSSGEPKPLNAEDKDAIKTILKNVTAAAEAAGGKGAAARVTTLPMVITIADGSTMELPLFRIEGKNGQQTFVDNEGRKYDSFKAWQDENRLMADFKVSYPKDGKLTLDANGRPEFTTENTRLTVDTTMEKLEVAFNYGSMVGGLLLGPAGWLLRGAMATRAILLAGQGLNVAFTGYNAHALYDLHSHGQSLSPMDGEARNLLVGLAATTLGTAGLQGMLTPARTVAGATRFAVAQNASMYAFVGMLGDQGYQMSQQWSEVPFQDRAMFLAMVAMMGSQTAMVGVKQSFSFKAAKHQMTAMMQPPKGEPNFLKGAGTRPLTPKEQKWLDAKLDALVSLQEQAKAMPPAALQDLRIVQNKLKAGQTLNPKELVLYNQLAASWDPAIAASFQSNAAGEGALAAEFDAPRESRKPLGLAATGKPKATGNKVNGLSAREVQDMNVKLDKLIESGSQQKHVDVDAQKVLQGLRDNFVNNRPLNGRELEQLQGIFPGLEIDRIRQPRSTVPLAAGEVKELTRRLGDYSNRIRKSAHDDVDKRKALEGLGQKLKKNTKLTSRELDLVQEAVPSANLDRLNLPRG